MVDSPALPKPVQQPHPPVIVGGHGAKRTPALAARFAAEINVPFVGMDAVAAQFARVDAACREIGRDPGELVRSVAEVVDRLGQWREKTGITRIYLQLMDLGDLDQVDLIAAEVAPQLG